MEVFCIQQNDEKGQMNHKWLLLYFHGAFILFYIFNWNLIDIVIMNCTPQRKLWLVN